MKRSLGADTERVKTQASSGVKALPLILVIAAVGLVVLGFRWLNAPNPSCRPGYVYSTGMCRLDNLGAKSYTPDPSSPPAYKP